MSPRFLLLAIALVSATSLRSAEILVQPGEKIAFLGDSITESGWNDPRGYARLVLAGLAANGVKTDAVPAGRSGHKSNQMLARLQADVLDKKPQWLVLSCGVNDLWHNRGGVPLDDEMAARVPYFNPPDPEVRGTFKKNVTAMIERAQAAGVKPLILTATIVHENLEADANKRLAPYNDFLRAFAAERKLPLADLNAMCHAEIKRQNRRGEKVLTIDHVHMADAGNQLMATGVLKAFGLDAAQLKKAEEAWAAIPPALPKGAGCDDCLQAGAVRLAGGGPPPGT